MLYQAADKDEQRFCLLENVLGIHLPEMRQLFFNLYGKIAQHCDDLSNS